MNPKVAIVAIAKDEAAYLSDWIHHHLYFGFHSLYIGLNRVTDSSSKVLDNISDKYKNVHCFSMDWIDKGCDLDKNPQMQSLSYSYLTQKIQEVDDNICTHILYIDIDEFWFPSDFTTKVCDYVKSIPKFDAISFNWLEQSGDSEMFSNPFSNLGYLPSKHVKSLIDITLCRNISNYMCHFPKITDPSSPVIHLNANGNKFERGKHNGIAKEKGDTSQLAYILHRLYRSEKEYLALLRRERPGVELPIKNNRAGFITTTSEYLNIELDKLNVYWLSLYDFNKVCGLASVLEEAKEKLLVKAESILDIDPVILINNADVYSRVLKGTYMHERFSEILIESSVWVKKVSPDSLCIESLASNAEYYLKAWNKSSNKQKEMIKLLELNEKTILKNINGPVFHRCATYLQNAKSYELAFRFISLAKLCRPDGPHILRKYNEISSLQNKETQLVKICRKLGRKIRY